MKKMYIKGFDKDLKCRGYQFEIGKEYKIDDIEDLRLYDDELFSFTDTWHPISELRNCYDTSYRFCEVEVLGKIIEDEGWLYKTDHIKIIREVGYEEYRTIVGLPQTNTGRYNDGSFNTGHYNYGWHNSGNYNDGGGNTGKRNKGHWNAGSYNIGSNNAGVLNKGNGNAGFRNIGDGNAGVANKGNNNVGGLNNGNNNIGYFNKCDYSNGLFCTEEPKIRLFNMETDYTLSEFKKTKYFKALNKGWFPIVIEDRGELKEMTYKNACKEWWKDMPDKDKETILSMPNFDKDVFYKITGIKV